MQYIAVLIIFLCIFIISYLILGSILDKKISIEKRIQKIKDNDELNNDNVEKSFFSERALLPFYKILSNFFIRLTPDHKFEVFSKRLERAGLIKNDEAKKWIFKKNMLSIVLSSFIALLAYSIKPSLYTSALLLVLFIVFINIAFNFYISRKIEIRKKNILKDLPFTMDLITVSIEAGLSFDGAMARVISNISGELCDEFSKSLKEIRMGIDRKVALKNLSQRCDVKELSIIVTSIVQADELGVSLGRVLRIEAGNLRDHRKQVAREKAMKAPIKMLFPLILFIFPSVFVIILGPAVIKIMDVFLKKG